MSVWVVASREDLARRLLWLMDRIGQECVRLDGLRALENAASGSSSGLAVLDCGVLPQEPGSGIRELRSKIPAVDFIVLGDEEFLASPAVSDLLGAGALDILSVSAADDALSGRLRAHLERGSRDVLESGGLRMDRKRREVRARSGAGGWRTCGGLTPKEFDILRLLLEHPGTGLERRFIMDRVWGERSDQVNVEAVDKHVASLRRKLGPQGSRIRTVRGVGYVLQAS